MESKLFFTLFLLVSSWFLLGVSLDFDIAGAGAGASAAEAPECLEKLLACQPYLVAAPPSPPTSCCVPLKEIIDNDIQCLCQVFDNPMIMNTLNVTKDEALKLPKACGNNIDASICKTAAATPPGTSETSTTSRPTSPISNSFSSDSTAGPKANAANGISYFGGSSFIAFFVVLIIVSVF